MPLRAASLVTSAGVLAAQMLRRAWLIFPALLLDPFDFWERYLAPMLPPAWQRQIGIPAELVPLTLASVVALAALLAYDDLRRRYVALVAAVESAEAAAREERSSNAHRKKLAQRVRDYMQQGNTIRKMIERGSLESTPLQEVPGEWEQKVVRFLATNLPQYETVFLSDGGPSSARIPGHAARTAALNRVERRLGALSTILQKVDPDLE